MTKKKARERFFREVWLPVVTGPEVSTPGLAPLSMLLDVYAPVYYLGPRGLLIEQQLNQLKELQKVPHEKFFRAFFNLHSTLNEAMRTADRQKPGSHAWYSNRLHYQQQSPAPELPDVNAYIKYRETSEPKFVKIYGGDRISLGSLRMFIGVSANYWQVQKRQDAVVTCFDEFCAEWRIPTA